MLQAARLAANCEALTGIRPFYFLWTGEESTGNRKGHFLSEILRRKPCYLPELGVGNLSQLVLPLSRALITVTM